MSVFNNCSTMYSIVILSIIVVAASAQDLDVPKCRQLMHHSIMRCCKKDPIEQLMKACEAKDCLTLSGDPITCARDICVAKTKGFATADEKLDKTKLEEVLTKDFESNPELLDAMKTNCINGDLDNYGAPNFCDFAKSRICISIQMIHQCPEWDDKGDCKGTKEVVAECEKIFS